MSDNNCAIKLAPVAKLEWNNPLQLEVVEIEPPVGGSFLALPGPKRRPVRPYLEPLASPGGIAARVLRGDGKVMPVAVIVGETPKVMELPHPPIALSMRKDGGVWVLNHEGLVHRDGTGMEVQSVHISGITLVGGKENAVWVVGLNDAWFVEATGAIRGSYPWKGGFSSAGFEDRLCTLDKREPRPVRCLNPNGEERLINLSFSPEPFEQLLAFQDDKMVTITASKLRRYNTEGVTAELTVQSAGLTADGDVFLSGSKDREITLCSNQGIEKLFHLPSDIPAPGVIPVVAVEGKRSIAYGLDRAIWYDRDRIENTFIVDEDSYRNDVFPKLWSLGTPRFATAKSDGSVVLSATGPSGLVLISIQWNS